MLCHSVIPFKDPALASPGETMIFRKFRRFGSRISGLTAVLQMGKGHQDLGHFLEVAILTRYGYQWIEMSFHGKKDKINNKCDWSFRMFISSIRVISIAIHYLQFMFISYVYTNLLVWRSTWVQRSSCACFFVRNANRIGSLVPNFCRRLRFWVCSLALPT